MFEKQFAVFCLRNFHKRWNIQPLIAIRKCSSIIQGKKYFTEKHEWVVVNEKNIATVGVSNYAQEALGDIVYIQLPNEKDEVNQSDECGVIESVKSASEFYSPLSGTIIEVNKLLEENPELINLDCLGQGWLFKLIVKKPDELKSLMNEEQYNSFLKADKDSHSS